ncbi:MAG: NFACT family protein, partial [Bacilli bacterium]
NIPLDERLSLNENAAKYFKLYQKSKVALEKLLEQKELTKEKISYFEKIQNQLKFASVDDINDINLELMNDGYIKQDKKVKYIKNKKKKKENEKVYHPHYVIAEDGTKIGFGLSSLQNEYLTFTIAHKEDYFLHIKDSHGPHVIIFSSSPSEETILLACEIALFYAEKSVGDIYICKRKDVKKIPSHLGLVNMNEAKTIYLSSIREKSQNLLQNLQKK